jgi:starch synthase (maltosyl-transferring)
LSLLRSSAARPRLNEVRRENRALQRLDNVTFLETQNDALIAYAKRDGNNTVIVVVNLDPHNAQEGAVVVPAHLGCRPSSTLATSSSTRATTGASGPNFVRLWPPTQMAHVLVVETQ